MTAIAILADAHLPDGSGTAQHACFEWAIAQLQRLQPDFIVTAGDMTACGDVDAARLVRQGIESVGVPFLSTPGNCEMRSLQTTSELESLLDQLAEGTHSVSQAYRYAMRCELDFFSASLDEGAVDAHSI